MESDKLDVYNSLALLPRPVFVINQELDILKANKIWIATFGKVDPNKNLKDYLPQESVIQKINAGIQKSRIDGESKILNFDVKNLKGFFLPFSWAIIHEKKKQLLYSVWSKSNIKSGIGSSLRANV